MGFEPHGISWCKGKRVGCYDKEIHFRLLCSEFKFGLFKRERKRSRPSSI